MNTKSLSLDFSDQVCLITGASGELGRVMARTFARGGASIAVHYNHGEERARALVQELEAQGAKAQAFQADVCNYESLQAMGKAIKASLGSPDIVIANAVIQYAWKPVLEQDIKDYFSQFESCVMQSVYLAKVFLPDMCAKGKGRYVAINTECSMQTFETQSAYAAGKKGLDALVRTLAKEVGPQGVTVNQVAPGWTVSERDRKEGTEVQEAYAKSVPLRRRGTDQEVANAVAFLASDLSSFITGVYLPVCGGNVIPGI